MNTGQRLVKQALALVSIVIAFGLAWTVAAQQRTGCEDAVSTLKQQLFDLELKETPIRMRLEELNEQLKPESIEREFAGIGSVRPEELREHRRKLLTIERNGLQTQLDLLEEERGRIDAAITTAGTAASLEYAQPSPSPLLVTAPAKNEQSFLPFDAPNRFVFWGNFTVKYGITVAPVVGIRNGFPLSVMDEDRNFVEPHNRAGRFPNFASLDLQLLKRYSAPARFSEKYRFKLRFKVFNLTNHFNPRDFQGNLASDEIGGLYNSIGRKYGMKFVIEKN